MSNLFPVRSALIALSGGIDSAVLLALAAEEGLDVHAATIVSEFTPKAEVARANALAKRFGIPWHPVHISMLSCADIRQNPPERCYLCKKIIMGEMQSLANRLGLEAVFDGTHADDIASNDRPGIRALTEAGIISPFAGAGIGKAGILAEAQRLELDALPPSACLATRIPHGTALSVSLLEIVDAAEEMLRMGGVCGILRVRFDGVRAVIETESGERETAKIYENKLKQLGIEEVSYRDYISGGV